MRQNNAFTLAETLITLGIIGVVAAMTIPTLITNYQKHTVETKVTKFYSTMNQALRLSVAENGTPEGWVTPYKTYTYDENVEFLETYISPYLKHGSYKLCKNGPEDGVCMSLTDGGIFWFSISHDGGDITYLIDNNWENRYNNMTHKYFRFQFAKFANVPNPGVKINSTDFIEPYIFTWNGNKETLLDGNNFSCKKNFTNKTNKINGFCTKLIQLNSWKIPSNYPW